jgi:hypothetical protein
MDKYLSVKFSNDCSPTHHFEDKLRKSRKRFFSLRSSGLLGGQNSTEASIMLAQAEVWTVLDSGRPVLGLHIDDKTRKTIRRQIDSFQMEVLRTVLSVGRRTCSEGVQGELGQITDIFRGDLRHMTLYRAFATAPPKSLPRKILNRINAKPVQQRPIFFKYAAAIIQELELDDPDDVGWKAALKQALHNHAEQRWRMKIAQLPKMKYAFPGAPRLQLASYLRLKPFHGRLYITKMRLNDLELNGESAYGQRREECVC